MAGKSLADLAAARQKARDDVARFLVVQEIGEVVLDLERTGLMDEAAAAEAEYHAERQRLEAALGNVVLTGDDLALNAGLVRGAVIRSESVLKDRAEATSAKDFALRRLEYRKCEVRARISAAAPVSEERERLGLQLDELNAAYRVATGELGSPEEQAVLWESVASEHEVNETWLRYQKDELLKLTPERVQAPTQAIGHTMVR